MDCVHRVRPANICMLGRAGAGCPSLGGNTLLERSHSELSPEENHLVICSFATSKLLGICVLSLCRGAAEKQKKCIVCNKASRDLGCSSLPGHDGGSGLCCCEGGLKEILSGPPPSQRASIRATLWKAWGMLGPFGVPLGIQSVSRFPGRSLRSPPSLRSPRSHNGLWRRVDQLSIELQLLSWTGSVTVLDQHWIRLDMVGVAKYTEK